MASRLVIGSEYAEIHTKSGDVVKISLRGVAVVEKYSWYVNRAKGRIRPNVGTAIRLTDGKQHTFSLDSMLFSDKPPKSHLIHVNGDYLDFRDENIKTSNHIRKEGTVCYLSITASDSVFDGTDSYDKDLAEAFFDTSDLEKVQEIGRKWQVLPTGYVYAQKTINGKKKVIYLHRLVMDAPDELTVDHINHNKLDNRRTNLRLCSQQENSENRAGADVDSRTGARNVTIWKARGYKYYMVLVQPKGKSYSEYFPFTDEGFEQAKIAADRLRQEHFTHSK